MAKKRGQNEGSIFKRKDGRWVAQVTIEGRTFSKYFKTQRECREWNKETLSQVDEGLTFLSLQTTLGGFLDEWIKTVSVSIRPKTANQYERIIENHIKPSLGQIKLKELRPDHVQSFYNYKLKHGSSPRSVRMMHSVLHRALNHAVQLGMVGRNASQAVIKPRLQRKEMRTLNDTQIRTLLLTAKGTRLETLLQVAVTTGLRAGELYGLKWSDLDWGTGKVKIQRQVQRNRGVGLVFCEPKSASGKRVIVLGRSTLAKLREHNNKQQLERQFAGDRWHENDLIFSSTIGTPMDMRNYFRDYKELLVKAGLPNIRFHDLRHTAATLMLQQGIHPKVVQECLGHSDISLTLNTYSHVLPGMQEEAAEKIDAMLFMADVTDELKVKKRA